MAVFGKGYTGIDLIRLSVSFNFDYAGAVLGVFFQQRLWPESMDQQRSNLLIENSHAPISLFRRWACYRAATEFSSR
jgi:hypothetical protein